MQIRAILLLLLAACGSTTPDGTETESSEDASESSESTESTDSEPALQPWRIVFDDLGDINEGVEETCGTVVQGCCTALHHAEPSDAELAGTLTTAFSDVAVENLALAEGERAVLAWVAGCSGRPDELIAEAGSFKADGTLVIAWSLYTHCVHADQPGRPRAILAIDADIQAIEHVLTAMPEDESLPACQ